MKATNRRRFFMSLILSVTLINLTSIISIILIKYADIKMPAIIDIIIFINPFTVFFCVVLLLTIYMRNRLTVIKNYLVLSFVNLGIIIALYIFVFWDYARTMSNF